MSVRCRDCCKIHATCFLPPLAVFLERGCGVHFCICLLLTILAWFPGVIFACCIVIQCPDGDDDDGGRVV